MDKRITYYLAGPMTGYPQFNYPLFIEAVGWLRGQGYDVISPAELDSPKMREMALASATGSLADLPHDESWGDVLARDVKLIADTCEGIILLPGWMQSKGANLEAVVGLLLGYTFGLYYDQILEPLPSGTVESNLLLRCSHTIDKQGGINRTRGNEHVQN